MRQKLLIFIGMILAVGLVLVGCGNSDDNLEEEVVDEVQEDQENEESEPAEQDENVATEEVSPEIIKPGEEVREANGEVYLVTVLSGDMIVAQQNGESPEETVRLLHVDTNDSAASQDYMSSLLASRMFVIERMGEDEQGNTLGYIWIANSGTSSDEYESLNAKMLYEGYGLYDESHDDYTKYQDEIRDAWEYGQSQ